MITTREEWTRISDNWERIVEVFNAKVPDSNDTKNGATPDDVARHLTELLGFDTLKETIAVVCEAKKHDGRIYNENRTYLRPSLPSSVVSDLAEDEMVIVKARLGHLDDIHPTHINQTISALKKFEEITKSIR